MLAAPWALAHSPWISALRLHTRLDLISRSISQSNTRTTSLFLRSSHPLGLAEQPKDHSISSGYSYVSGTSKVDGRKLVNLVKEGNFDLAEKVRMELLESGVEIEPDSVYERAIENLLQGTSEDVISAFSHWASLLPDAHESNPDLFRGIRQRLSVMPGAHLPLILAFGRACASKGYLNVLRDEILPIVAQHADSSTNTLFLRDIEIRAISYREKYHRLLPFGTEEGSLVFEDSLEDYALVNSESPPPPPPSVLTTIMETLPEVLPRPSSKGVVFEEESDKDYVIYSSTANPTTLGQVLRQCLRNRQYDEANRMLQEIQELGTEISHSPLFKRAAEATLRSSSFITRQERLDMFSSWLSLVTPAHLGKKRGHSFLHIRQLIFEDPSADPQLIARFALILVSKGYLDPVAYHAIPFVMRSLPFEDSRKLLTSLERKYETYCTEIQLKCQKHVLRGAAVKALVYSNKLQEAVALLSSPESHVFRPTRHVFNLLLDRLQQSRETELRDLIPLVRTLWGHTPDGVRGPTRKTSVQQAYALQPGAPEETIRKAFLRLKREMTTKHPKPHIDTLSTFIDDMVQQEQSQNITKLRSHSLSSSPSHAALFLFAEMRHYRRQGSHELVIQTFADHFHLVGVPQEDVITICRQVRKRQMEDKPEGESSPARIPLGPSKTPTHHGRLWPAQRHCVLVWHSILALTSNHADIDRLYQQLLRLVSGEKTNMTGSYPLQNVATGLFTPFIKRLTESYGTGRGVMVLRDMLKLGMEPNIYHYTELAGRLARDGDVPRAMAILDKVEASAKAGAAKTGSKSDIGRDSACAGAPKESVGTAFPPPDIAMYTSLMHGFVLSKKHEAVEEVNRRFKMHHQYIPGRHEALDRVYTMLKHLRETHGHAGQDKPMD